MKKFVILRLLVFSILLTVFSFIKINNISYCEEIADLKIKSTNESKIMDIKEKYKDIDFIINGEYINPIEDIKDDLLLDKTTNYEIFKEKYESYSFYKEAVEENKKFVTDFNLEDNFLAKEYDEEEIFFPLEEMKAKNYTNKDIDYMLNFSYEAVIDLYNFNYMKHLKENYKSLLPKKYLRDYDGYINQELLNEWFDYYRVYDIVKFSVFVLDKTGLESEEVRGRVYFKLLSKQDNVPYIEDSFMAKSIGDHLDAKLNTWYYKDISIPLTATYKNDLTKELNKTYNKNNRNYFFCIEGMPVRFSNVIEVTKENIKAELDSVFIDTIKDKK